MKDKQNDKQFENALKNMQVPPVDKQAKKRAVNLAMAAFDEQQLISQNQEKQKSSQGFTQWLRPIGEITTRIRRLFMNAINNKVVYSALGSVCIAVLCFGVITSMTPLNKELYSDRTDHRINEQALTAELAKEEELAATVSEQELQDQAIGGSKAELDLETTTVSTDKKTVSKQEQVIALAESKVAREQSKSKGNQQVASKVTQAQSNVPAAPETDAYRGGSVLEEVVVAPRRGFSLKWPFKRKEARRKAAANEAYISHDMPVHNPQYQDRDTFEKVEQNPIKRVTEEPVSTFSVDVDTSSYSFIRRQLNNGYLPQKAAVRVEEMINYFDYSYEVPASRKQPFKPSVYITPTPWNKNTKLIHIGIKGYEMHANKKPASNLVFLLDVSGSMSSRDKLPLVKQSMALLLDTLNPDDTISIVVYAGAAGTVLEPTKVKEKRTIMSAIKRLEAGGSTAGAQGIKLAYELAETNFDKEAVNRVILATDGDFNVGITDNDQLQSFIERKRKKGIFLSVLGFGQGNYQDHRMQTLAQNGNGVAAYIDTLSEAQKVLVDEASSMLFPIAKDVKLQVEFNPETVSEYRLIGYETRHLNRADFNNDKVDAGDIGAGHTVTAIYEITPASSENKSIDDNRYQQKTAPKNNDFSDEYAFLKIRYKLPDENESKLITQPIVYSPLLKQKANKDVEFATAVAAFAQILKGGKYTGDYSYSDVIKLAKRNKGIDDYGYRSEFIQLVRKAKIADSMR